MCHLSVKIYRFSENLPRCQAHSEDQLSSITWRNLIFLFQGIHSSSIWGLCLVPTPVYGSYAGSLILVTNL